MNIRLWTVLLISLLNLAGCQVEDKSGTDMISGHKPATNAFSLQNPSSKIYVDGDTLSIVLNFPLIVTVDTTGGTPSLALDVGGTVRAANYISGSGSVNLTFQYIIVAADNDNNGVRVNSLSLNGGTMTFDKNGLPQNCSTTITAKTFSNVIVDNTAPTITAFAITTPAGYYHLGDKITFTMTFSEAVIVTGSPSFTMEFSTPALSTGEAVYSGGSGTTVLTFQYTIPINQADSDGYIITPAINLNTGTIVDAAGLNSSLDFTAFNAAVQTSSATRDFDGRAPYIINVTPPANGTYTVTQNLDFVLEFNRSVNVVAGVPYISINIGGVVRQANYQSGSPGTHLTFRYTVVPGDYDIDGITIDPTTITANGGNIYSVDAPVISYYISSQNNVVPTPAMTGIHVSAIQPAPTAVSRNTDSTMRIFPSVIVDNYWIIGQQLLIRVDFNTEIFVNQAGGVPRIPLTIGAATRYATYLSGGNGTTTLYFTYSIQEGDQDTDGSIAMGSIDLNGGTIMNANNTNSTLTLPSAALTTTYVDGVRPVVSNIALPALNTYSNITGNNHLNMLFTVTWSEAVRYASTSSTGVYIPMNIGGVYNAVYASGNSSATIIHRPASLAGRNDLDGIVMTSPMAGSSTVSDQAGNLATDFSFAVPDTSSIFVDTTPPTVFDVTPPANSVYTAGQNMDFVVNFLESVTVNVSAGYPRIPFTIGGATRYLVPTSSGTGSSHTFRYTVVSGDLGAVVVSNSIAVTAGGYVRDAGQNLLTGTFPVPNTASISADGDPPTIVTVTPPSNGTYQSGTTLNISLVFSEAVTVANTPRIQVTAQTGTLNFDYASGSGTTTLVFSYLLTADDFDFDGLSTISSIDLNGGTITGSNTVAAQTSFTSTSLASVFISYPGIEVWVTNAFTNRASSGTLTTSSAGAVTSEACGTGTCRTFNGDDTLAISNPYNGVRTIFIVFKTSGILANYDIFPADISLTNDGSAFDIAANGTIDINGSSSTGPTHDTNLGTGTTNILQVDFASSQNLNGTIIPASFLGAVGDVIIANGVLTVAQKAQILIYLNTKY